jgi:hypothetical protein
VSPPLLLPGTPTVKFRIAVDPLIDQVTMFVLSSAFANGAVAHAAPMATAYASNVVRLIGRG